MRSRGGGVPLPWTCRAISRFPRTVRVGKRLKRWKTKPILSRRMPVRSASSRHGDVDAVHEDAAAGGPRQPAQQVQQGGLAAARGPDDGDELAALHVQVHAAQRLHVHVADVVDHAAGRSVLRMGAEAARASSLPHLDHGVALRRALG